MGSSSDPIDEGNGPCRDPHVRRLPRRGHHAKFYRLSMNIDQSFDRHEYNTATNEIPNPQNKKHWVRGPSYLIVSPHFAKHMAVSLLLLIRWQQQNVTVFLFWLGAERARKGPRAERIGLPGRMRGGQRGDLEGLSPGSHTPKPPRGGRRI